MPQTIKTIKGVNVEKLKSRQKTALKTHSKHHTTKHIREMKKLMLAGKTFSQSHRIVMKKVGM